MSYLVTARKWRPMIFEDVVGQTHVTSTLKNALARNRIAHAYIFSGTRGCGKTTTARILARAVNCESPADHNPDNTCAICQEIITGRSLDVIEIDGASNRGIEEIRNLRESVRYAPSRGSYKIYIIDEVHMLTKEAFNALLKTLEEPPSHVIFVFATTEIHKVPMTILSRCQRFDFRRIATDEVVERLKFISDEEKVSIGEDALTVIARKGDGSMRDAQSIFDQVHAFCGDTIAIEEVLKVLNVVDQEIYFKCSAVVRAKDSAGALALVDDVVKSGHDLREFAKGLAEHYRNLLMVTSTGSSDLVDLSASYKKRYEEEAALMNEGDCIRMLKIIQDAEQALRFAQQPRYKLEATMVQLARMEASVDLKDLVDRLEGLKRNTGPATTGSTESPGMTTAQRSNVRVVGAVNAGPMTSPVAERYSSFFAKQGGRVGEIRTAGTQPAPEAGEDNPATSSATHNEQIETRWHEVVDDVLRTRIAIGTTLSESRLLDVQNGTVRIACPDEYHVSTLKRHKEFLAETVFKLVGARVMVEPVLKPEKVSVITYEPKASSGSVKSVIETQTPAREADDHPVIEALKRELGAERID